MEHFYLTVTYTTKPGCRETFLNQIIQEGLADTIRQEDGCLRYDYFLSAQDDVTLLLMEKWESKEKQQIHMTQPHMARLSALREAYVDEVTLEVYQPLGSL